VGWAWVGNHKLPTGGSDEQPPDTSQLGYAEGQNLIIEFRYAEGRTERLPGLAAELIRLNVDVVVVASDRGSQL